MSSADEPHAFISYVHEDSEAVDGLEAALEAAGVKVWRDKNNLGPGDDWQRVIRQAIQGSALAFIPCFSKAANEKERTVMREEIYLAIAEYKLRPPDRPWILSVRFDDCEVPDYDLVSGKTLRSLNWSNLFDAQYPSDLIKLVERVKSLLGTTGGPAAATAAIGGASDRVRGSLIAAAVRDGAADPSRAAEADQQVRAEARKVVDGIKDEQRFPTHVEPFKAVTLLERHQQITSMCEPLVEAAVALGAYGKAAQARVATDVVTSLARVGTGPRNGIIPLLDIFKFPASVVMYAGALGAVATENSAMLQAFILKPETATNYSSNVPVHQLISAWDPYTHDLRVADLYAKTLSGAYVDPATYDQPSRGGELYMAPQAVLMRLLKPYMEDFTIDDAGYDELYFRMEVIVGAAVFDACGSSGMNLQYSYATNWVGHHIVGERYTQTTIADRVAAEFQGTESTWWPLGGGALFGGDPDRARTALTEYVTAVLEAKKRLRF